MKTRTGTKAGGIKTVNHNESMRVRSSVKAGGLKTLNHNEAISLSGNPKRNDRPSRKQSSGYGIKVMSIRSGIKAGWISRNYK